MHEQSDVQDRPDAVEFKLNPGEGVEIEFENVKFTYPRRNEPKDGTEKEPKSPVIDDGNTPTLRGLSFKVPAGKSVAIVGHSGSGKVIKSFFFLLLQTKKQVFFLI